MSAASIAFRPIGTIHSEHRCASETPVQSVFSRGCTGRVVVFDEFSEGLLGLEGHSHIYLLYHFHQAEASRLRVVPFLHDREQGIFATRAPNRPNPIGLSIVELKSVAGNTLLIDGVDILDGTPLLDIKPYTRRFDRLDPTANGWQDEIDDQTAAQRGRRGFKEKS